MKIKSLLTLMIMFLLITRISAQELPPKHRGDHPILKADGSVVDKAGRPLGTIRNGKICLVDGKVIGTISTGGDVTTSGGKSIGKIQTNGTMKAMKGHLITTDPDGSVKVAGKEVAKVESGYGNKSHGCALHCFFDTVNEDAKAIDDNIKY